MAGLEQRSNVWFSRNTLKPQSGSSLWVLLLVFVLGDSKVQFGFRDASQETKCNQSEQRGLTQV